MLTTDEILIEDWQGLESELERLFMIYGYPVDDLQEASEVEETAIQKVVDTNEPAGDPHAGSSGSECPVISLQNLTSSDTVPPQITRNYRQLRRRT